MSTLKMNLPLPSEIMEKGVNLSSNVKLMIQEFLALPTDLSLKAIAKKMRKILFNKNSYDLKKNVTVPNITKLQQEHEQYFNIKRYSGDAGDLIVQSVLESYFKFASDCQVNNSLSIIDLEQINTASKSLIQYVLSKEERK